MTAENDADDRRRALRARREGLYAEQKARTEARERADTIAAFMRWHGDELAGVAHQLHWPWDAAVDVRFPPYPWAFSGVDWTRVPDAVGRYAGDDVDRAEFIADALDALRVAPEQRLYLQWGVAHVPDASLACRDVRAWVPRLLRWGSDLWIHAPGEAWLIEAYHEGTVTYAARPPG